MHFRPNFAPKCQSQPLDKINVTDPSNPPPCKPVRLQKVKQANLVASMWKNATTPEACIWAPEDNGWVLENDGFVMNWFDGRQVPEDVCCYIDDSTDAELADENEDEAE
jgi:hypothetical protein